jgi:nucleotide-binding universal stress UspA family protein
MKTILVCTDGSPYSEACCHYAAWMAHRGGMAVKVLYVSDLRQFGMLAVADLGGSVGAIPYEGILSQVEEIEVHKAKIIESGTRAYFEKEKLTPHFQFIHAKGFLLDRLNDLIEKDHSIEIVMLGKRGENADFAADHLGTSMERVVRATTKPCFVTPEKFSAPKKVLLAYDGSHSSKKALKYILHSLALSGLDLHVVTVAENSPFQNEAPADIQSLEPEIKKAGFKPHLSVLSGLTEEVISEYTKEHSIDLLIMGAYGHSRIRHLIIGSTTTDLIRRCNTPVILFR